MMIMLAVLFFYSRKERERCDQPDPDWLPGYMATVHFSFISFKITNTTGQAFLSKQTNKKQRKKIYILTPLRPHFSLSIQLRFSHSSPRSHALCLFDHSLTSHLVTSPVSTRLVRRSHLYFPIPLHSTRSIHSLLRRWTCPLSKVSSLCSESTLSIPGFVTQRRCGTPPFPFRQHFIIPLLQEDRRALSSHSLSFFPPFFYPRFYILSLFLSLSLFYSTFTQLQYSQSLVLFSVLHSYASSNRL